MNILITGAGGQLGRELATLAPALSGHTLHFTDVEELDLTAPEDSARYIRAHAIDLVINCAAYTAVDRAEDDEATAMALNAVAVARLAQACREQGACLIHVSTDYVFDGQAHTPLSEAVPPHPRSVYGRTKLQGEQAIVASGCSYIIIRTSWLYSPHGTNFVKTMLRLMAERASLRVVYDQIGTPTYALGLAGLIVHIIKTDQLDKTGLYHYSDEGVASWYDFAVEIARLGGYSCSISPCLSHEYPTRAMRPHYSVLDKEHVRQTFGITIPHWRSQLVRCLERMEHQPTNQ